MITIFVRPMISVHLQHDNTHECAPGGSEGNYIMFGRSTNGDLKNNRLFSPCSREKMNAVMDVKGRCNDYRCCFRGKTFIINC